MCVQLHLTNVLKMFISHKYWSLHIQVLLYHNIILLHTLSYISDFDHFFFLFTVVSVQAYKMADGQTTIIYCEGLN